MHLASGHWYTSGTFFGAASLIAIVFFGALGAWLTWSSRARRRQVVYGMSLDTSLLGSTPLLSRRELKVLYKDKQLEDPRVMWVNLMVAGSTDVSSTDFDGNRPLVLDIGVRLVALLGVGAGSSKYDVPPIMAKETALEIGPGLLRSGLFLTLAILADGRVVKLTCPSSPLINVDIIEAGSDYRWNRRRRGPFRRVLDIAAAVLVAAAAADLIGALTISANATKPSDRLGWPVALGASLCLVVFGLLAGGVMAFNRALRRVERQYRLRRR